MESNTNGKEWELVKENVQPLREGSRQTTFNVGSKTQRTDPMCNIKAEKYAFETELRTYSGDDPIEVWYRYILWAEQNSPKSEKVDSSLTSILERCVRQFKDVEKYRNDERFIYAWLQMAELCCQPLEIYKFMHDQNIGCELSCFYKGWASLYEQVGSFKKATAVIEYGIKRNAKPIESLQQWHKDFQKRLKIQQRYDKASEEESKSQHRQVLSQLRTVSSMRQASLCQNGEAVQGSAGAPAGAKPKNILQTSKPSVNGSISAVNLNGKPSAAVHVDEIKKEETTSSTSSSLPNISVTDNKTEKAMYCKDKIYCGHNEYTFEELRAVSWLKKQENIKTEAERQALAEKQKQQVHEKQMLEEAECIRIQKLKLHQEEQAMIEKVRRLCATHQQQMEGDRLKELQHQDEIIEQIIQFHVTEQLHQNISTKNKQCTITEVSLENSSDNCQNGMLHHARILSQQVTVKHNPTPVIAPSEDASSALHPFDSGDQPTHVIDVTTYIPPETNEKTKQLMNMSICIIDPKNPFNKKDRDMILNSLKEPLSQLDGYNSCDDYMPNFCKEGLVSLGRDVYSVIDKIGVGGNAKVFSAKSAKIDFCPDVTCDDTSVFAIKVQKPAHPWEFYICHELHYRLAKLNKPVDVRPGIMKVLSGNFFKDGSCLVTEFKPYGTLLNLGSLIKTVTQENISLEPVMMYMTIELLHMVENIHKCQIIHGDIKPDNFLVLQLFLTTCASKADSGQFVVSSPCLPVSTDPLIVFGGRNRFAQLIDFGQSIDMTKYPPGTTFLTKVITECFQCIEMKTDRPWTYQTDLFALAGTIHVLIFNQYMKVYQERGTWKMTSSFARNWNSNLWKMLFSTLLNVPSCDDLPDLAKIRCDFEQYFVNNLLQKYNAQCTSLSKAILVSGKTFNENRK